MTVSSSQQMTVFLLSILAGIGCGIFFDFLYKNYGNITKKVLYCFSIM